MSNFFTMKSSVRMKVFIILSVIVLIQAAYLVLYLQESQEREIERNAKESVTLSLSRLQGTLEYLFKKNDLVQIREEIAALGVEDGIRSAFIVNEKRQVVASIKISHVDEILDFSLAKWSQNDRSEVVTLMTDAGRNKTWFSKESQSIVGVFPIAVAYHENFQDSKKYFLVLQYDLLKSKYAAADLIYHVLAYQVLLVLVAALLIHLLVTRRVILLRKATDEIVENDYTDQLDIKGSDEIAELGRSLNVMSKRILGEKHRITRDAEQMEGILNAISEGVMGFDVNNKCLFANASCGEMLGFSSVELLRGKRLAELLNGEGAKGEEENDIYELLSFKNGKPEVDGKYEFNFKADDVLRSLDVYCYLMKNTTESLSYVIAMFDVTESKKIQDALLRSEETYGKAEEIAHIGSWDWNIQSGDLRWTDEIYRIFGQEPQSFGATYDAFLESIHVDDRDKVVNAVNASVADELVEYNVEHRVVRANSGEIRVVQERGKVYRNESGSPVRMIGTVYDITDQRAAENELDAYRERLEDIVDERTAELKKAQVELVKSERLATLGQLTATVSHELRNPLGAMRPSLYIVKKIISKSDLHTDVKLEDSLSRIDRNIDRCDHIIDELLDFTRITALDKQKIDVASWLDGVIDDIAIPESVSLIKNYVDEKVNIVVDRGRFRRAVINVVDNAYQATLENPETRKPIVEISVHLTTDRVCLFIKDNGVGISKEVEARMFEPLFSTKGFGVGLGMPTVLQIMKQHHGGCLWCLRKKANKEVDVKRVLIVDDNKDLADGFSVILDEMGYAVKVGYDGQQARELIEEGEYDIAFIDIKLPEVSGMELLSLSNRLYPAKKVVLMTGFRIEQVMETVSDGLPVGVLRSPADFQRVLDTLNSIGEGILLADIDDGALCQRLLSEFEQAGKHAIRVDSMDSIANLEQGPDVFVLPVRFSIVRSLVDYMDIKKRFGNVATVLLIDNGMREENNLDVLRSLNVSGCLLKPFSPEELLDVLTRLQE